MTEAQLKTTIGFFLIVSHFAIILLIVIFYLYGGFQFDEMTTAIALIIPMFSVYTTAIIKYFIAHKEQTEPETKSIRVDYTLISFLIPSLFVSFIIAIIILKAFNIGFSSFDQFKTMLAVSETAFGAYLGLVLSSLFEIK